MDLPGPARQDMTEPAELFARHHEAVRSRLVAGLAQPRGKGSVLEERAFPSGGSRIRRRIAGGFRRRLRRGRHAVKEKAQDGVALRGVARREEDHYGEGRNRDAGLPDLHVRTPGTGRTGAGYSFFSSPPAFSPASFSSSFSIFFLSSCLSVSSGG